MKHRRAMTKALAPKDCRTDSDIIRLRRDNIGGDGWWVVLNSADEIVICNQRQGEDPTGKVHLSRSAMLRMCRWYLDPKYKVRP
jgi:hypothetical protein